MQRLEVSGAVRPIYESLGFKRLTYYFHEDVFLTVVNLFFFIAGIPDKATFSESTGNNLWHASAQWVDTLRCKPEGRVFDSG